MSINEPVNYQGAMLGGMGPPVQQAPFESEWRRLLKQSQVQQAASKKIADLGPALGKTRDIYAYLDACMEKHKQDHIWDMLVLAAESSRHGT